MAAPLPNPVDVQRAIDVYVKLAYPAELPFVVRSQLETLKTWSGEFMKCPVFVPDSPTYPARYTLRLGNQFYPHMKLAVELTPRDERWVFRADTHDRHLCPAPKSPEYSAFMQLVDKNEKLAVEIESAWEQAGLPTFKAYLREDLQRRRSGGS